MDAQAIAGRSGKAVWLTQLFRWSTADFDLRLTTGGTIIWAGETFRQRDPAWGVLGALPTFDDGIDSQTSRADITIYPASHEALATMADRKHQGTSLAVWDASIDPDTGLLMGQPDLLFQGRFDFARFIGNEAEELILECGTDEAWLIEPNEDRRLSDPFHRSVWPGELGMSHVTGLGRTIYWRQNQPGGISGGGGYVGGGGSGGETFAQ